MTDTGRGTGVAAGPCLVWLLSVASLVPWRQGTFYNGGADPVVVAKALLQCVALLCAAVLLLRGRQRHPLGGRTLGLLLAILAVSVVGAYAQGNLLASGVLAVRVVLLAATVMLLLRAYPARTAVLSLLAAMASVGAFSALTGIGPMLSGGRLGGAVPPLSPNDIALLCGLPALGALHEVVQDRAPGRYLLVVAGLAGLVLATGSRTAIFAWAAGAAVILLYMRRPPLSVAATMIVAVPAVFAILSYTPLLSSIVNRADSGSLITLNSRTISWDAVLAIPFDTWERWLGSGLSVKQIAVTGQYWENQVFDSSWISALAQAGVVGVLLLALWTLRTAWDSLNNPQLSSFTTGALLFMLVRSVTENGLVDASVDFVVLFTLSVLLEKASSGQPFAAGSYRSNAPSERVPAG